MKPIEIFRIVFVFAAITAACISTSAQSQTGQGAWQRFVSAYSDVFLYLQQERNCCATTGDPLPLMEASINRIIAKFRAVDATGIPPGLVKSWKNLRDKHIAGQEAQRDQVKFLAKVRAENPTFRISLDRDPRGTLPPSYVSRWDTLVAAEARAQSAMNSSVAEMDKAVEKFAPKR